MSTREVSLQRADRERARIRYDPEGVRLCPYNLLFWKGNKEGAGTCPAPLEMLSLLFRSLATGGSRLFRRRLLRGGGLAFRWLLPLRYCHDIPPSGWLAVKTSL